VDNGRVTAQNRYPFGLYLAWVAVGAGVSFGVLSILSIGVFVLAVTIVATFFLGRRSDAGAGVAGVVSGFGLPLLYIAFLNRSGPGMVCDTTSTSTSCSDQWSPWPWLLIGSALILVGLAWFIAASRRRARERTVSHH
jgi:hypothetical protein